MPRKSLSEIKKRDLFNKIAVESGISSVETVKMVYYGMVRLMGRDLKKYGFITLPDWGQFKVHQQKERGYGDLRTKEKKIAPSCKIVKYVPDNKLKNYIKNLE